MKFRQFAKTRLQVSELGFGGMSLGKNTEAESMALIHQAIDKGINYFDTADIYDAGANEILLGKGLKAHRQKILLATKVGNVIKPDGNKGFDWDPSKAHILRSINESLTRLKTDYVDLYQLHGGTMDDPIDEIVETFELLKQQGKILHYGISSIRPNVIREYVKRSNIESVMMQYSLLDRRPEETILDLLKENHISVMVRGALAQGLLANKPPKEYLQHSTGEVLEAQKYLAEISGNKEKNTAVALSYVLDHAAVCSAVTGFRTREHLDAALLPINVSEEKMRALAEKIPAKKYEEHR